MSEDQAYRTAWLIAGYIRGTLTDAEKDELDNWITESDTNMELFAELTDKNNIEAALEERGSYNSEAAIARLKEKITTEKPTARRRTIRVMYAVAAAVSILLVLFIVSRYDYTGEPAKIIAVKQDVPPGTDKAVLTTGDGRHITLDSAISGHILPAGGTQVTDSAATLYYTGAADIPEWHTLTTPRGGQYRLQLPDGSLVWLNAESSIHFPTAFTGRERKVAITGEAYFEVAKDPARKFIVTAGATRTEVLGTHFNISAYPRDSLLSVSLAEGMVTVTDTLNNKKLSLQPGGQAVRGTQSFIVRDNIDLEQVLAWKNGWFYFRDETIEAIMRQVSRWYDVDIKYEGNISYHFDADIERNVTVSKLFDLLEKTGRVHFEIKGKTIIVKP